MARVYRISMRKGNPPGQSKGPAPIAAGVMILFLFIGVAGTQAAEFNVTDLTQLEAALSEAASNEEPDTIFLAAGTYFTTRTLTYDSEEDCALALIGESDQTVLDGGGGVRILYIWTHGPNASVELRDLTLQNGFHGATDVDKKGGGLFLRTQHADITIEDCRFLNNQCSRLYFSADAGGAFVRVENNGTVTIKDSIFRENSAATDGGGLYLHGGLGSNLILVNNVFQGNSANSSGGAGHLRSFGDAITLTNNTITGNTATSGLGQGGGGIYVYLWSETSTADLHNNIVWGNSSGVTLAQDVYVEDDGNGEGNGAILNICYNDFAFLGLHLGDQLLQNNNIDQDPMLDSEGRPQEGSPCLDAGDNSAPQIPSRDLSGKRRILNHTVDMGAYEVGPGSFPFWIQHLLLTQ